MAERGHGDEGVRKQMTKIAKSEQRHELVPLSSMFTACLKVSLYGIGGGGILGALGWL